MSEDDKGYTVGQYLVDRLHELDLEHLFSIAGDYTIEWVTNYVEPERSGIKVIEEVNELCAGYAADGYARLKGIGALCVTYSAGALSAVNAIAGSYEEKVPVVLINGTPSIKRTLTVEQTGFRSHHQIGGRETNLKVFEPITVARATIDHPDSAPRRIDEVLTECITKKGPVYIELLQDIVDLSCERPKSQLKQKLECLNAPENLKASIERVVEKLSEKGSSRPLIWLGVEVDRFGLREKAELLIRKLNIPFTTELMSKAVLSEDDSLFIGVFDGKASLESVQKQVEEADFILALGVWLTDLNTLGWNHDFNKTVFVSHDTIKYGGEFWPQVCLESFLDALLESNLVREARDLGERAVVAPELEPNNEITYQGFYDFIQKYVDKDTIVACDPSLNYYGVIRMKVPKSRGFVAQSSYTSIGYAGPAATGICLAKMPNEKVMVVSGDGGFQETPQCLSTQARFGLNPIIFVIDNGWFAVEQHLADASRFVNGKPFFQSCELRRWNYSLLKDVFGCYGYKVNTYGQLKEAVEDALEKNKDGPSIIQVVVPEKSYPEGMEWKVKWDIDHPK